MIKNKKVYIPIIIIVSILLISLISFIIYTSIYYKADKEALEILEIREDIIKDDFVTYIPSTTESEIGFIFYPGAKVEEESYLPLLNMISQEGIHVYLIEMPFRLAIFGSNRADYVIEKYNNIDNWYIGGHSMGGAFASSYASKNQSKIDGLVLLGAYLYGNYPVNKQITINGSNDLIVSKLNYSQNVHIIDGGNHANFGNYGKQKGDGEATISKCVQQEQTTNKISVFVKNNDIFC